MLPDTFWGHIEALRKTLFFSFLIIILGVGTAFFFHEQLFTIVTSPLRQESTLTEESLHQHIITNDRDSPTSYTLSQNQRVLSQERAQKLSSNSFLLSPGGSLLIEKREIIHPLVTLGPLEGFLAAFKLSLWVGIVGTSPVWILLVLAFIVPGLKSRERSLIFPFLLLGTLFFISGFLFGFYVTLPIANRYLKAFGEGLGQNLWSVGHYLDYTTFLLLAHSLAFELCALLLVLVHYGVISGEAMRSKRRFVVVGIFVLSAILTPPDVITQLFLAIPLLAIYELIILYATLRHKPKSELLAKV